MRSSKIYLVLILGILAVIYHSCRSNDEEWNLIGPNPNYVDETFFSPPGWILGKWESRPKDDSEARIIFEFTPINIIDPFWGDQNKAVNNHRSYGFVATVEETKSDSSYTAVINWGINPKWYRFQKTSKDSIFVLEDSLDGQIILYRIQ